MTHSSGFTKKQYIIAGIVLLLLGVIIVKFFNDSIVRPVFGDYLVVLFQYCILRTVTPWNVKTSALIVLIFSYLVEILQFFDVLNILGVKQSFTTDVIVGSTFDWWDMLAYTLAYFTILFIEKKLLNKSKQTSQSSIN